MKRLLTFSIIALFLASCGQKPSQEEVNAKKAEALKVRIAKMQNKLEALETADEVEVEKVYNVKVEKLQLKTVEQNIEYSANLIPFEELYMAPAQPGKITKIYVEVGDFVQKGQKLVQMDQTQLDQAKIQLESLKKDYARIKSLKESGSIAEQQYDQIKTQLEVTESNVRFLEENTVLIAPYNGVITAKYFEDNETFGGAPNTQAGKAAIVTLQQINVLKAIINVSENYFTRISVGKEVKLTCDIYPNEVFKGEIMNIYPVIDPMSHAFKVEVKVPNWDLKLRPGMFTRNEMTLGSTESMVVASNTVLQQEGTNKRFIFINKNNVAQKVYVEIGKRFDDKLEIISDEIQVGDEIVVAGQAILSNKSKLSVIN